MIVGEEWIGTTNADGSGTYWDIIKAVYSDKYEINVQTMTWARAVNMVKQEHADILIGVPSTRKDTFYLPNQHIDTEHPVFLLYEKSKHNIESLQDLADLTIAGRATYGFEDHLPKTTKFYGVEAINNINRLIINGRIDGALVYSYNAFLADPTKTLDQLEILPKEKLFIGIVKNNKGKQLKAHFDKRMQKLVETGELAKFFPAPKDYFFADYYTEKISKDATKIVLVPRVFKQNSHSLDTLPFDDTLALKLMYQDNQHDFNLQINNFSATNEILLSDAPACMINASKRKDRESYLWYSDPIYAYVPPKIISLVSKREQLTAFTNKQGKLDLTRAVSSHIKVAVNSNKYTLKLLKSKLPDRIYKNIIQFDALENQANPLEHLIEGKVDALIAFPAMVSSSLPEGFDANSLTSFTLDDELNSLSYGYFVCNKLENNKAIIEMVNKIMSEQQESPKLFEPVLNSLDPESRNDFAEALKLKLN